MKHALILDSDGSVASAEDIPRRDLKMFAEKIRYYASFRDLTPVEKIIEKAVEGHRIFFLGSGDFHHLSYLLIKHMPLERLHVVVFDNHSDNMFFPFGIHCGSWVYHASKLPNVSHISVIGISSGDVRGWNLLQNRFPVMRSGKVNYYCLAPVSRLARWLSGNAMRDITTRGIQDVQREIMGSNSPVYLSIDKDVLSRQTVRTTWDQGKMYEDELLLCVQQISPRVEAADIVGDISFHHFRSPLKAMMRRLDGKEEIPSDIAEARRRHWDINRKLLMLLGGTGF